MQLSSSVSLDIFSEPFLAISIASKVLSRKVSNDNEDKDKFVYMYLERVLEKRGQN